ncbi:hypothetical protein D3C72_1269820 [compost metagenome]
MLFHQAITRLITLYQQHQAQIGHVAEEGLHRTMTAEQDQHALVFAAGLLGAEKARHLFQMLSFVGYRRFETHVRDDNLALLNVVKRRRQGFETIAGFLAQPAHFLQARKAVQ